MSRMKDFEIPFVGLALGNHHFEFELNQQFFEHFEFSQISDCALHADCILEKQERMMVFHFTINGTIRVTCDRCAGEFDFPVTDSQQLIVKFGTEHTEESEDVVIIPETDHKFDLSPYLYEFAHLALPPRILHPDNEKGESTCDPEMLRRIDEFSHTGHSDSRWDILKNLNTTE